MNNIDQNKLNNIASNTQELVEHINQGVLWVDKYLKQGDKGVNKYNLKKYRRQLNRIKKVVNKKPSIALFGASQVGKSYMANNLLYNKDSKLLIHNGKYGKAIDYKNGNEIILDYIKYINPEGNQSESTGTVTRFTADTIDDENILPVIVKLFNVKDIIIIICDSYYSDFNDKNEDYPTKVELEEFKQNISNYKSNQEQFFITDDDVFEIKEYLDKYFTKKLLVNELKGSNDDFINEKDYWSILANNIKYIPVSNWLSVFNILWNRHSEIDQIFSKAINELNNIGFATEVRTGFESLYRDSQEAIINIRTLELFFNNSKQFEIQINNGSKVNIPSSVLSFLTSEIVLSVSEETTDNREFIKDVDIIDFPGARARKELNNYSEMNMIELLKRGKVSYLFNSYSIERKTNVLAACMRTAQSDAPVPALVNQWISDNIGKTANNRYNKLSKDEIPPFFVIFTWWNTQFKFNEDKDTFDPEERIKTLFETRYKEEIISDYEWHDKWTEDDYGNVSKFYNFYLLRDFKEAKYMFKKHEKEDKNDTRIEENDFPSETQEKFHKFYYERFEEYHKQNNRFFKKPLFSLDAASSPNNDGSELIIENLIPASSKNVTVPIYLQDLNDTLTDVKKTLQKHHKSEENDEQIKIAAKNGIELQAYMNSIFGADAYNFGYFIEQLTVSEYEILHFYSQLLKDPKIVKNQDISKFVLWRKKYPRLTAPDGNKKEDFEKNYKDNLEIMRQDMMYETIEDLKKDLYGKYGFKEVNENGEDDLMLLFNPAKLFKDTSFTLAEEAKNYWFDNKLNSENAKVLKELGFTESALDNLFENLKTSYKKLDLTELIAEKIRKYVDGVKKISDAEDMIAHITAGIINEFVNNVGWTFYSDAEKEKIRETNDSNSLNLEVPDDQKVYESLDDESIVKLFDFMENLNDNLNKFPLDEHAVSMVPMIKNYGRWSELMKISFVANCDIPTYNVEANRQLGEIIEKIVIYNFSI